MIETRRKLAPGIFDNHVLKLWHDWQALITGNPTLKAEWRYERDDTGVRYTGPSECLSRTIGNVHLRVILGGDGQYTPLAEMDDRHGVKVVGPGRVIISVSPPRGNDLFMALTVAEEAAGRIGQPSPPYKLGRPSTEQGK